MSAPSSDSMALAKRSSDLALMPPPPPPKRIKRPPKVLDEDNYTAALSHIIARDFFPGLLETETQQEYLNALDAGDKVWIHEAGQRVRQAMTPGRQTGRRGVSMTPRSGLHGAETPKSFRGQTPGATPKSHAEGVDEDAAKDEEIDSNMSLSAFQAKYTSEDNESFNRVLDKQNEKRAEKYRWLYNNNKLPTKQRLLQASIAQKRLLAAENSGTASSAITLRPSQDPNDRPASIAAPPSTLVTTAQGARNAFMFFPTDLTESQPQHTTIADAAQAHSLAAPRSVTYGATRLPTFLNTDDSLDDDDTASLSLSAIDAAIRGRPRRQDIGSITAFESSSSIGGGETPRVNGYAFVDAEPTAAELKVARGEFEAAQHPEDDDENDDLLQKMITSAAEHNTRGPNPFSITEQSAREDLHHRLVDKTLASKRASFSASSSRLDYLKDTSGRTPTPKFASSPRTGLGGFGGNGGKTPGGGRKCKDAGGLTPAARMLYSKLGSGGRTPVGGGGAFDRASGTARRKGGWTPTPIGVKKAG